MAKDFEGKMDLTYPPFRPTELTKETAHRFSVDDLEDYPFLYPMLQDTPVREDGSDWPENEQPEEIEHPVIAAIIANDNKWDSVEIIGRFRDDHCDCYNIEMVVGGKKYGYSDWWLAHDGVTMYIKCSGTWEDSKPKYRTWLLEHIMSSKMSDDNGEEQQP